MTDPPASRSTTLSPDPLPGRLDLAIALPLGGLLASCFLALFETLTVIFQGETAPQDLRGALVLLGSTAALLVPPGLLAGLLPAAVVLCFPRHARPAQLLGRFVRWLEGQGGPNPRWTSVARLFSLLLTGLVFAALAFFATLRLVADETTEPRAATLLALGLLASLPLLWLLHQAFLGLLERLVPRPRPPRLPGLSPLGLILGVLIVLLFTLAALTAYRFWHVVLALELQLEPFAMLLTWVTSWLLASRLLLHSRTRLHYVSSRLLVVAPLLLAGAGQIALHDLDRHEEAKIALLRETLVSAALVEVYQRGWDRDGDGVATVLGENDCDDTRPDVYPGARDVPGNGIDEDCWGGDAIPQQRKEPTEEEILLAASRPHLPPAPNASGRYNVVMILMDTVRWQNTSLSGYKRDTTPRLQALGSRGTIFTRVWSQAPQTKSSAPSILTGRYTSEVYRSTDLWLRFYPENLTFPEMLQEAGYRTAAVASHEFFNHRFGLSQGFEHWDLGILRQPTLLWMGCSEELTRRGIEYLSASQNDDRPFFLWMHYIDPHHPYAMHKGYSLYGTNDIDLYDGEIRYTDEMVGRLIDWIEASPYGKSTIIIVHSDHGEGFREHGYSYHGQSLYEDQIRVPLVLYVPGQTPRVVSQPTGIIDLAPTVLAAARVHPRVKLQGESLIPLVLGAEERPDRLIFSEIIPDERHVSRKAMIKWPYKLEYAVTQGYFKLYDIERDPLETRDLMKAEPETAAELVHTMRQWMSTTLEEIPAGTRGSQPGS